MDTERALASDLETLRTAFTSADRVPPLGWDAVRAFEAGHGITLPEPYRTFVAEIADGSAAGPPEYGLLPLAEMPRDWGEGRPERILSRPFPLVEEWTWCADEEEPEDEVLDPVFDHGSLVLGTDGCGQYWHLVVTGPRRGDVWLIAEEGACPFGRGSGSTTGAPGFAGWVAHWAAGHPWFE